MTSFDLSAALSQSQRLGFLGERPIDEVIAHAEGFVHALESVTGRVVDLGSGGGVPGLVIADRRPDLELTLVDRRMKRTDFLDRMVAKFRLGDRVQVRAVDTDVLTEEVGPTYDAAVARGFGPPLVTLRTGVGLVKVGGLVVISEPPEGDRWAEVDLQGLGVERTSVGEGVVVFSRVA